MSVRIDISGDLTLPCHMCDVDTPRLEKLGWKPGMVLAPEWHEWFSLLQKARKNGGEKPASPDTDYYMLCSDCSGTGEKPATLDEFMTHHLTAYQLELFKNKKITFSKGTG